jgi:predicted nucleic acid-binding protein
VRFWDASALVPLMFEERESERLDAVGQDDKQIAAWWGTLVEVAGAIERRHRRGDLKAELREEADARLAVSAASWYTVPPVAHVRTEAIHLTRVHGLRAGDAFQLAAALEWSGGHGEQHAFVTLDRDLRAAAAREGFAVLPANG